MTKLEEVALLKEQMRNLLSQAKTEKRSLTDEEQTKFNELMTRKNQIVIDETLRSLESSKSAILPENKELSLQRLYMTFVIIVLWKNTGILLMQRDLISLCVRRVIL